jgi:hypothetical protein
MDKVESEELNKYRQRWEELKIERSSWMSHWREISDNLLPRSGRFFIEDRNRGQKRHNSILDSTGTKALKTLAAGMQSTMTSPARPWFRLSTSNPDLDEASSVKTWLADVTRQMQMVFSKSNTYRALHSMYLELGAFGTAATIVMDDYNSVIHHHTLTVGEYCIATNAKGVVDTLYREFQMTVSQVVGEFGLENCSQTVQTAYNSNKMGQWITILHVIEPRKDRDPDMPDNKNMPWMSCYIELGTTGCHELRESGFKTFPALCPRWDVVGGDIYGNSPGMDALGDIKQLQHEQLRKGQGIDFQTKPPLQVPSGMKNNPIDGLPGGVTFVDQVGSANGIKNLFDATIDLRYLLTDIQDVRERIRSAFFADIFLMLSGRDDGNLTATEAAMRNEEKMLMLGPVGERQHNELLSPLIDLTFDRMAQAGILPPIPDEIRDMELSVEFVSVLAQAQRAVATNSVDRFIANIGAMAQFKPEVLDKLDADAWADEYGDMLGVSPDIIVPEEKVAIIRQQRQQQQAALQAAAQAEQMASAAQKLGTVQTPTGNAGNDIMAGLTGYTP